MFLEQFKEPETVRQWLSETYQSCWYPTYARDWETWVERIRRMCWLCSVRWPEDAEKLLQVCNSSECKEFCKEIREERERARKRVSKGAGDRKAVKGASEKQIKYLRSLGYRGPIPQAAWEVSKLIDRVKG